MVPDANLGQGAYRPQVVPINPSDHLRFFATHLPVFHERTVSREGARLGTTPHPVATTGVERRQLHHLYGAHL